MSNSNDRSLEGQLLDQNCSFSMKETLQICSASSDELMILINEGIIEPESGVEGDWQFDGLAVSRAVKAIRIQHQLEIDWAAAALVLDLLQEIESLKRKLVGQER